jgi:hypothetical protein
MESYNDSSNIYGEGYAQFPLQSGRHAVAVGERADGLTPVTAPHTSGVPFGIVPFF